MSKRSDFVQSVIAHLGNKPISTGYISPSTMYLQANDCRVLVERTGSTGGGEADEQNIHWYETNSTDGNGFLIWQRVSSKFAGGFFPEVGDYASVSDTTIKFSECPPPIAATLPGEHIQAFSTMWADLSRLEDDRSSTGSAVRFIPVLLDTNEILDGVAISEIKLNNPELLNLHYVGAFDLKTLNLQIKAITDLAVQHNCLSSLIGGVVK